MRGKIRPKLSLGFGAQVKDFSVGCLFHFAIGLL